MDFNNTTTKAGLIQDCEHLSSLGDTGITGNATLLKKFTHLINQAEHKVVGWILTANGSWEWDDPNYTDFPIGTKDLVAGQLDYNLPTATGSGNASSFLKLLRLEVLDVNGDWQKVEPIDESRIGQGLATFEETNGLPRFYREIGNSVELYPQASASACTLTGGLKCYFQRSHSEFNSDDTTKQPGIPVIFHRLLSLQASLDYAAVNKGMEEAASYIKSQRDEMKQALENYYADRNKDKRVRIVPKFRNYN